MPSKTFLNLPEEKQQRIIHSGLAAFSEKVFERVKVVHICKMADIPRGTFYSYFSSLADLYSYLFFYVDELFNFDDMESALLDKQLSHWEAFLFKLTESDQGQRIIFDDLKRCSPEERVHYHLLLSLIRQYSLCLLTKNELLDEYRALVPHILNQS